MISIQIDSKGRIIGCATVIGDVNPFEGGILLEADLIEDLMSDEGVPRYKYEDGEIVERNESEIEEDRESQPPATPSVEERLEAAEQALLTMMEAMAGV